MNPATIPIREKILLRKPFCRPSKAGTIMTNDIIKSRVFNTVQLTEISIIQKIKSVNKRKEGKNYKERKSVHSFSDKLLNNFAVNLSFQLFHNFTH